MEVALPASFTRGLNSENRKVLVRSVGSFSVVEDLKNHIVIPTPIKVPSVSSPKSTRGKQPTRTERPTQGKRKTSREDVLFGEAGFEIQSILFQSMEAPLPHSTEAEIVNEYAYNKVSPKLARVASPPLRASNPITMNSPFHPEEKEKAAKNAENTSSIVEPTQTRVLASNFKRSQDKSKELRTRSASWPAMPSFLKKAESQKEEATK